MGDKGLRYHNAFIILLVKSQLGADSNLNIGYSGLKPAWFLPAHEHLHMVIKMHSNMLQFKVSHWGGRAPGDHAAAEWITKPFVYNKLALNNLLTGFLGYEK